MISLDYCNSLPYKKGCILFLDYSTRSLIQPDYQKKRIARNFDTLLYSDFSKLGCLWESIIGETRCIVFDLKKIWEITVVNAHGTKSDHHCQLSIVFLKFYF